MKTQTFDYLSDDELEAAMRMYDITDREMQVTAVGYMYGMADRKSAGELLDTLPEDKVADSYDYFCCHGLPAPMKQEAYESLKESRKAIMEQYGIGAIEAVSRRQELKDEDFTKAVESVPETSGDLAQ